MPNDGFIRWLPAMRGAAYRFTRWDPDDLVQAAVLDMLERGRCLDTVTKAFCCNLVRFVGMRRREKETNERKRIALFRGRLAAGLHPDEMWGRVFIGELKGLKERARSASIAAHNHRLELQAYSERVSAAHTKKCLSCGRGIPEMLTYCSVVCEKAAARIGR